MRRLLQLAITYTGAAYAAAVSLIAQEWMAWQVSRRPCPHWMVQMTDGPVCEACGRSWIWRPTRRW